MAVPKYRPSSQRQGRRRKQHQQTLPELTECLHCGATKRPHFACPSCGQYGTKPKQEENKTEKNAQKKQKSRSKA